MKAGKNLFLQFFLITKILHRSNIYLKEQNDEGWHKADF